MAIYWLGLVVGVFLLVAALFNWDSLFIDYESRIVELLGGEMAVRWYWGLAGAAIVALTLFYGHKT